MCINEFIPKLYDFKPNDYKNHKCFLRNCRLYSVNQEKYVSCDITKTILDDFKGRNFVTPGNLCSTIINEVINRFHLDGYTKINILFTMKNHFVKTNINYTCNYIFAFADMRV